MTQEQSFSLVRLFSDKAQPRAWMHGAIPVDNNTVATNTHCGIAFPAVEDYAMPNISDSALNAMRSWWNYEKPLEDRYFSLPDLMSILSNLPVIDEIITSETQGTCPECSGEGTVTVSYRAEYDGERFDLEAECPICDGIGSGLFEREVNTGKKIPDLSTVGFLGIAPIPARCVRQMAEACRILEQDRITIIQCADASAGGLNIYQVGEARIVCMAMLNWNNEDKPSFNIQPYAL